MTDSASAEVSTLLSDVLRQIHRLSAADVRTVMEVDARMRRDTLRGDDAATLRAIAGRNGH
ncbi:MAG: hypothetical protein EXR49_01620 [Dehalococcoidia bacterium]|nr:hypothetical protein [Dehalococcoidia bacterium]